MMKRIIKLLMLFVLCFSVAGCFDTNKEEKKEAKYAITFNKKDHLYTKDDEIVIVTYGTDGEKIEESVINGAGYSDVENQDIRMMYGESAYVVKYHKDKKTWESIKLPDPRVDEIDLGNEEYAIVQNLGYSEDKFAYNSRILIFDQNNEEIDAIEKMNSDVQILAVKLTDDYVYYLASDLNNASPTHYLISYDRKKKTEERKEINSHEYRLIAYGDNNYFVSARGLVDVVSEEEALFPQEIVDNINDASYLSHTFVHDDSLYIVMEPGTFSDDPNTFIYELEKVDNTLKIRNMLTVPHLLEISSINDQEFLITCEKTSDDLSFYRMDMHGKKEEIKFDDSLKTYLEDYVYNNAFVV